MPFKRLLPLLAVLVPAFAQAQGVSGKLVLYTSQPNTDAQQTIDAFKAKHPGSTSPSCATARPGSSPSCGPSSKRDSPRPTCSSSPTASPWRASRRKAGSWPTRADVSAYPAGTHDPQKHWFSTKLITTGIVYNTKATFKPTSWTDLVKPEVKGQLVMPSPLNSGAALIHAATLTGSIEAAGNITRR